MKASMLLLAAASAAVSSASDSVLISTFDNAKESTQKWHEVNDPVMGGQSSATFDIDGDGKFGIFNGTTRIVPSLKAPGFCNAETESLQHFPDASGFDNIFIVARSSTPDYAGFKLSIAAKTLVPQFKSYKANFNLTDTGNASEWQTINIPITSFSNDWSPYTGDCDTKDPTGKQHHCCSADHPDNCPTKDTFSDIEQVGIWSEGHADDFHLEVLAIGAGTYTPME